MKAILLNNQSKDGEEIYEGISQQKILVCHVFVSLCDICKFWLLVCESCDIFGGYSQLEHLKG